MMPKLWLAVVCGIGVMVVGCEDNPDQIYKKAPPGAANLWNDGKTPASYDRDAKNSFADSFNAATKQETCSGPVKAKAWGSMVNQPLVPPRFYAGLDLAGSDSWSGLDLREAEDATNKRDVTAAGVQLHLQGNCQSQADSVDETNVNAHWGDSQEVTFSYIIATNTLEYISMNQGYRGTLKFHSRPDGGKPGTTNRFGNHTYEWFVGQQIRRDGTPWDLEWTDKAKIKEQATEMYDAMMYTFAPEMPGNQEDCKGPGLCVASVSGVEAYFGARPIGAYFAIPNISLGQPAMSTPGNIYAYYVKLMPFSNADLFLKMDQEGPTANAFHLGDLDKTCAMKLGMKYNDFINSCVNVEKDQAHNETSKGKLFGGLSHTTENYAFSVDGVNLDFESTKIGQDKVIGDDWVPDGDDDATRFVLDIRARGKVMNDYSQDGTTFTFGGTAAIYREYGRLVQEDLHKRMKELEPNIPQFPIGSLECIMPANADPNTWRPKHGCTGFETFVTPAAPDTTDEGINRVSIGAANAKALGFVSAMIPGNPVAVFCGDPSNLDTCVSGPVWQQSLDQVKNVIGGGDEKKLPAAARDVKYFFMLYGKAYSKYLINASKFPTDLSKPEYDNLEPDELLFDQIGESGELEEFEYIDRRHVTQEDEPLKFVYRTLVIAGNHQDSTFHKRLTRAERSLYWAMSPHKNGVLATTDDNVRLTNLVGSTVIKSGPWADVYNLDANGAKTTLLHEAHWCATHTDPDCQNPKKGGNGGNVAPVDSKRPLRNGIPRPQDGMPGEQVCPTGCMLDDGGDPIMDDYRGAFKETVFSIGSKHMKLLETLPFIASAKVAIPNWADPYEPPAEGATSDPPRITLVDWHPLTPENGIRIPANAVRDKFIPAATVNFTGSSIGLDIDYEPDADGSLKILGIQSDDYIGDVFLCQDPSTGDILRAEQFESIDEILDWVNIHPGSYDYCDLLIRYSDFDSYPVLLAARNAGVILVVDQGTGVGHVTTIELYDTSLQ